ncbi:oxygenase MpaB family protein [Herbiconiux sp. YIM B11900]|uniref:oxygenase MpaB family protein n=1 Tax=Herbiconiux sp. YIM B11900 TaxID=3404131 RepID=UPI003F831ACC
MSSLAEIAPESVLLAGAGRAILLQIALPEVGYGVARHSDFAAQPMKRLNATLSYIYALSGGTEEEARIMRAAVNRAHRPVRNPPAGAPRDAPAGDAPAAPPGAAEGDAASVAGPGAASRAESTAAPWAGPSAASGVGCAAATGSAPSAASGAGSAGASGTTRSAASGDASPSGDPQYDARDPELQLWVAATLYETAVTVYELVHGPLAPGDAERVYREYALLGTALQMPEELWPADRAAFRAYWSGMLERLHVDATVQDVADTLLRAENAPLAIRAGMPLARFVTVALLPESLRAQYGFSWTPARERRFRRLVRVAAPVYRVLPARIRHAPQRHYLARIRSHAHAHADVPAPARA